MIAVRGVGVACELRDVYKRQISHLDTLRLFKRAFKRSGIRLSYSKGFNPHPKMGFAQPLPLGYSSVSEYLEVETEEAYSPKELERALTGQVPEGIRILFCRKAEESKKSLAAKTTAAEYIIGIPAGEYATEQSGAGICEGFLAQDVYKRQVETFDFEKDDQDPDYRTVYVEKEEDAYVLSGKQLEKIFNSTNFNDSGSMRYLYKYIEKSGAIERLRELGVEEGDTIRVIDYEFEYFDEF